MRSGWMSMVLTAKASHIWKVTCFESTSPKWLKKKCKCHKNKTSFKTYINPRFWEYILVNRLLLRARGQDLPRRVETMVEMVENDILISLLSWKNTSTSSHILGCFSFSMTPISRAKVLFLEWAWSPLFRTFLLSWIIFTAYHFPFARDIAFRTVAKDPLPNSMLRS